MTKPKPKGREGGWKWSPSSKPYQMRVGQEAFKLAEMVNSGKLTESQAEMYLRDFERKLKKGLIP